MSGPRQVLVLTGRHRPHQLMLLLFSLLVGAVFTFGGAPPPQSLVATMPEWNVRVWAAGLLVSGAFGIGVALLPLRLERGLWVEFGAMLVGAGALVVTLTAVFEYAGPARGAWGGGLAACWAAANLWRAVQILRDLREIK